MADKTNRKMSMIMSTEEFPKMTQINEVEANPNEEADSTDKKNSLETDKDVDDENEESASVLEEERSYSKMH